jgi:hypothetical protein
MPLGAPYGTYAPTASTSSNTGVTAIVMAVAANILQ